MTDFPISHSPSVNSTGKISGAFAGIAALVRVARHVLAQAIVRNAERRAPVEILAAQARREEARRAVDRLLQRR